MAELQSIIYQIILSVLRSSEFTSASPGFKNQFIGVPNTVGDIGNNAELEEAILEIVGDSFEGDSPDNLNANITDAKDKQKGGSTGKAILSDAKKTLGGLQNPNDILMEFTRFFPPAVILLIAASMAPLVFDILTKPGGPMDVRWKRLVGDEVNAFLSRQSQKDTEMGVRQVIIQSKKGFTAPNGVNSFNTTRGIREGGENKERSDRIGMIDHAKGVADYG